MRLIDVDTRKVIEFIGRNIPPYAILSHTWTEGEELTYQQYVAGTHRTGPGYRKIDQTCRLAKGQGIQYVWIDACCIDKSSSAELSEAINSMFRWYQRADICYVYLADLEPGTWDTFFDKCRWFTRGWTLQELIAPRHVLFLDAHWRPRLTGATKMDMIPILSQITKINPHLLDGSQPLSSFSVAQKMSWASHRTTTRIEDEAYSLLGIFDFNMPLLYGEEEKAFQRLQMEILRSTPDLSILAWMMAPPVDEPNELYEARGQDDPRSFELDKLGAYAGLSYLGFTSARSRSTPMLNGILAASPAEFQGCSRYRQHKDEEESSLGFDVSNIGIRLCCRLCSTFKYSPVNQFWILRLDCITESGIQLGIRIRQVGAQHFVREEPWSLLGWRYIAASGPWVERYFLTKIPQENFGLSQARIQSAHQTLKMLRKYAVSFAPFTESGPDYALYALSNPWPPDR